ncbi:sterol desaturase family protein [Marinomonas transparens]|nr:sterol desaturase family protein [Marinomonas transparens]
MALLVLGALCVRLVQPLLLSFVAVLSLDVGLLDVLALPFWWSFLISILLLDCLIYWQHRLFHRIPWLWCLHRVHHSDPELDVSSAVRFHPLEILLSLFIKASAVWFIGIPVEAVLVFDILLNASAMFNHTNARLPAKMESFVNRLLVTPDMHRIHHSRLSSEADSNYGFCLSIWDSLFASRTWLASQGDECLSIGMPNTKAYRPMSLKALLVMPFKNFRTLP